MEAIAAADERAALQAELRAELRAEHPLFGLSALAIARRDDQDDVVFALDDGRVAEVHLTWRCSQETDPRWPQTTIYPSLIHWREDVISTHPEDYPGTESSDRAAR
ncbi:MAG: hypothetical protein WA418_40915 [Bradyrhizobium sp.]